MPRASWRGFLRLSLVSCLIYLSPAATRTKPIPANHRYGAGLGWSGEVRQNSAIGTKPLCDWWTVYSAVEGQAAVPRTTTLRAHDFMPDLAACSVLACSGLRPSERVRIVGVGR